MTCRDCIHYYVCDVSGGEIYINEQVMRDDCPHFMRKDNTIEVVRCKDCIYYESNCCFNRQWDFESSSEVPMVRENDFCSYGERRDQNEG